MLVSANINGDPIEVRSVILTPSFVLCLWQVHMKLSFCKEANPSVFSHLQVLYPPPVFLIKHVN